MQAENTMEYEAELIIAKLKGDERLVVMIERLLRIINRVSNPPYRGVIISTLEKNIRNMINETY